MQKPKVDNLTVGRHQKEEKDRKGHLVVCKWRVLAQLIIPQKTITSH